MDALAQLVGISSQELMELVILALVLLGGLFLLRLVFKLTAAVFRLGCLGILLLITAVYLLRLTGQS